MRKESLIISNSPIKVGDRVAYRAAFLRSIHCYCDEYTSKRGTVILITDLGGYALASVKWDRGSTNPVAAKNLVHAHRIHLEPN